MKGRKTIVRVISACLTLVVIVIYASTAKYTSIANGDGSRTGRHLMMTTMREETMREGEMDTYYEDEEPLGIFRDAEKKTCNSYGGSVDNVNCSKPLHHGNESCQFVEDNCSDDVALINYLAFVTCNLPSVKPLGFIILGIWLIYLISLLATTADYFFVPPLNLLAEKLRLSPSIAGITLLAVGNGAPDVFTAYSALNNGDMPLVLGALIGASIFISTVVLGTVILVTNVSSKTIDKIDFVRDVIAYMVVVGTVIGVAFDGYIHIYEAVLFPILYFIYIAVAVALSYFRVWWKKRRGTEIPPTMAVNSDKNNAVNESREGQDDSSDGVESAAEQTPLLNKEEIPQLVTVEKKRVELPGLTWPRGQNIFVKVQWFLELPFSFLRWISVPPCCHDGHWSEWHRWFAVCSPVPMVAVLIIAAKGWAGFTETIGHHFPVCVIPFIIAILLSIGSFFVIKATPPHWIVQSILGILAFVMSIAWLNIEANEVVSVLETFGLAFSIDTAVLGLTVLAIGNSVGDWVADTAVARAGEPGMGVASCFGSPLLNDVLGLSVALIARIAVKDHGKTFKICIHDPEYVKVKLSWIFLGISLVMSAVVFPLCKFSPPRWYGIVLIYIYVVFMVFSVLDEVNVLRFNL